MIVDCDRHAVVADHRDLFPYMTEAWRRHFGRDEWFSAVTLATNHIRVSDQWGQETPAPYVPADDHASSTLVVPNQALTVNGWADRVAARVYVNSLNSYGLEHWTSASSKLALVVSPYDPVAAAEDIRRQAESGRVGAVALPLVPDMLGSRTWDPIYETCTELGLPLVAHYSGVEGRYLGAPPLSGGVHVSAFARLAVMPHLAESNISSLTFEGAFMRHPGLQILFLGFGFTWLPSLLWRIDREWRTFRHDVPWVTAAPSEQVLANMWFSTHPVAEAADSSTWEPGFPEALRGRVVFGSHDPYHGDSAEDVVRVLGAPFGEQVLANGANLLSLAEVV